MKWRLFSLALMVIGIAMLAFGIYIEVQVRQQKGEGFFSWISHVFAHDEIEAWRNWTFHLLVIGPGVLVVGIGLWFFLNWVHRSRKHKAQKQTASGTVKRK